ncbi:MAG: DUF4926 domain-containing protein [Myxococcales bacterium]|nr:DUF4926 domain-containing protein [Myxococcales bacterium]
MTASLPADLRYVRVALAVDVPYHGLRAGDVCVVLDVLAPTDTSGGVAGVAIEVHGALGDTVAVVVVAITDIQPLRRDEVFSVRCIHDKAPAEP